MQCDGRLIIGAQRVPGGGQALISHNPSTGAPLLELREASQVQVGSAVAEARRAFESWQDAPLAEREALLRRYAEVVKQHKDALARLISDEAGKPLWESATEVAAVIGKVDLTIQALRERRA
jgi:succinylglutamic semialdehyde dehydrogenase